MTRLVWSKGYTSNLVDENLKKKKKLRAETSNKLEALRQRSIYHVQIWTCWFAWNCFNCFKCRAHIYLYSLSDLIVGDQLDGETLGNV